MAIYFDDNKVVLSGGKASIAPECCCGCCPNPPETIVATFQGGGEDGWTQTLHQVSANDWTADGFDQPPDPDCAYEIGLKVSLSCDVPAGSGWIGGIAGWQDATALASYSVVSVSCEPFEIVLAFHGAGPCSGDFNVRFTGGMAAAQAPAAEKPGLSEIVLRMAVCRECSERPDGCWKAREYGCPIERYAASRQAAERAECPLGKLDQTPNSKNQEPNSKQISNSKFQ